MIHEVDEGLQRLLAESGLADAGVELVFDAPTKDWSARRNAPTISVFLHDIREDTTRRQTGSSPDYDEEGTVIARRAPARWFTLTYLLTAWTNRPKDEHRLLSQALRCLVASDVLPKRLLTGSLAELDLPVTIDVATSGDGPEASDVWSALGGELKAGIDVRVSAPLSGEVSPAGPPVTEGLVVRALGGVGDAPSEPGRRLRYDGASDPGPDGFTSRRDRPLPPGRRRRRGGSGGTGQGKGRGRGGPGGMPR